MENNEWLDRSKKFKKGNPGRKPGTTNKFRQEIKGYLEKSFPEFLSWMQELKPREKVDAYLSLLPYGLSRLQSVSITDPDGNELEPKATIDYTKLSSKALSEILKHTQTNESDE